MGRVLLWSGYCFLFIWLTPVYLLPSARWIEIVALILNLLLVAGGVVKLWQIETSEPEKRAPIHAGAGRGGLCVATFGLILIAQILRRWLGL